MELQKQILNYINSHPEQKRIELQLLHDLVLRIRPTCKVWFNDGKNNEGKIIANPTIGYGSYTLKYANGITKDFFRIGVSTNKTGISVYILGLPDKNFLTEQYGKQIGKARVTGYCIHFKSVKEINIAILEDAIRYRLEAEM